MTMEHVEALGRRAKAASLQMGQLSTAVKNSCLLKMAAALREGCDGILEKNALDVAAARAKGTSEALIDRLTLTKKRVEEMAKGLEDLAALKDPIGQVLAGWRGAQDIEINKVRVPMGVIGIIYEARPNVTADAAGICFKTGNAVILRGSGDALESNRAIVALLRRAIDQGGRPDGWSAAFGGCQPGSGGGADALKSVFKCFNPSGRSGTDSNRSPGGYGSGN